MAMGDVLGVLSNNVLMKWISKCTKDYLCTHGREISVKNLVVLHL